MLSSFCAKRSLRLFSSSRCASTLVVAEPLLDGGIVSAATQAAVTAAQRLGGDDVSLLVLSPGVQKVPTGIQRIYQADTGVLGETVAQAIQHVMAEGAEWGHVVAPASKFGSTVIPRFAAMQQLSPITDVIEIISPDTFVRPMYAGNALAKVKAHDEVKVLTVRPTSFEKAPLQDATDVTVLEGLVPFDKSRWVAESVAAQTTGRPDLRAASVVVSGGRGLKSGDNFSLLESLADKLGGAVGASRAAVDAGMVTNDKQVGQTGVVVAPDLYIAVGISGAIQHLSGMKDSKTIVAINKDPEAPIFQVSDYGLVDDLFSAIPEMTEKL